MLESLGNLAGAEFLPVRAFLGFFCKISTPERFKVVKAKTSMSMKMFHPKTTILLKNCARTSARTKQSSFQLHKQKITLTPSLATPLFFERGKVQL